VAVSALAAGTTEHGATAAVWLIARDWGYGGLRLVGALTLDPREEVRLAAMHVLALWAPNDALQIHHVARGLKDSSPRVRRVAAEAYGRMRRPGGAHNMVPAILESLGDETNDRTLDHALTFALIEIGSEKETAKGLEHKSARVRRACLAALEAISGPKLDSKAILAELDAKDPALRETAWWIAGRHPQWGDQLAGYFKEKLKAADKLTQAEREEFAARLVKFAGRDAVQQVLGDALDLTPDVTRRLILGVMARSGLKTLPKVWKIGLVNAIGGDDEGVAKLGCAVLRAVPASEQDFIDVVSVAEFPRAVYRRKRPDYEWLALISASPTELKVTAAELARALTALGRDSPSADRGMAAEALLRLKLTPEQFETVAAALKTTGPLELPRAVQVYYKSTDEKVGLALVAALRDPAVRPAVRAEIVKPILDKYPKAVKDEAEKLYAELAEARKGETARLEKLLADMKPGDVRRGQIVFNSAKTNCIACHTVGYVGGTAGPDLTRIGGIRSERDLLESVLYPSASFVRSFEPYRVVTTDDRTLNGVLKKDAPDEIVIVVAADKEERISRAQIESIAPSTVSLMPAGLEQQLSPQEIADLLAFLKTCR
jgi:putative heme-binding domain-containing protein